MTAREAGLLLVSVGRFGFFDNSAASRQECGLFRRGLALFESFTLLLSLSASLREYDIFIRASIEGLVQALFEGLVFFLCSLVPDVCRYPFEDAVYLGRYRASLRDVMVCQTLLLLLFENVVFISSAATFLEGAVNTSRYRYTQNLADMNPQATSLRECGLLLTPAASLRECGFHLICSASLRECGFHLICSTSLRECGLQSLAGSLREFRLDSFSADRLNSSPPSVAIAPPPTPKFAIS
ncbi:hypothetical protein AtubIFM56815_004738 [Aspergillus tubingensis]|uniref:Uncharacterized protein n=2 Tax=Aspergillus subgen. Circumdati TaxID=2720871 RepID=A0A100INT9_ASPNG|nr:uncharacterized protein AtWU_07058 [Aspergillus tubingensis]GAQ44589.1 hypothetical protein An11g08630 [Aspergillus niger]GFN17256.1 hypothetical protein AtWU_07058 [Aspergillus tubingensis]GLA57981.1 hypothetical protein AtubIFM54640_005784 [Aspergillus tubingensis]GLA81104.1 hypothetical protein AtubIFM56815_004738 [Aspergillus tubingensis]